MRCAVCASCAKARINPNNKDKQNAEPSSIKTCQDDECQKAIDIVKYKNIQNQPRLVLKPLIVRNAAMYDQMEDLGKKERKKIFVIYPVDCILFIHNGYNEYKKGRVFLPHQRP
ncbi:hypothetical protein J3458_003315 [Metarhizium acridum]|uniref:uncharacterized protein n=1 Tax=Metarhizium acridum TaxID=92637 RepID=UPI001C6AD174|nr:hypothetical protein J3458_003315 [Metarhizium acridum]